MSSFISDSLFSSASAAVMTLSSQPESSLARRMFCPPRPMACDSLSSSTATSMLCLSSSTTIETTSAGANRINAGVVAADSDFGAQTRISGCTQNVNEALSHFLHFNLEKLDQELG